MRIPRRQILDASKCSWRALCEPPTIPKWLMTLTPSEALLAELDQHLVKRLMQAGVPALEHIIVVIGSDGHAHVHGNVDLNGLKTLAGKLIDLLHEGRRALSDVLGLH